MKILIVNDDGIDAPGLRVLVNWATKLGDVTVAAPKTQQSAKSHAINVRSCFEVTKYDYAPNVTAYSVDSTPVDCVRFATLGLKTQYDIVFSGINKGFNIGEDILYSGTAGAIFEASLRKHKAIAFSTDPTTFDDAEKTLDEVYKYIIDNKLFDYNDIYNVNIPLNSKGIKFTRQGGAYFTDNFVRHDDTHYEQIGYSIYVHGNDMELDTDATMNGYTSVTPLTTIRSDDNVYRKVKDLIK